MKLIWATSRSCTLLADEKGDYTASKAYVLTINGKTVETKEQSVVSVFGLWPDTEYQAELTREGEKPETLTFRTAEESYSLDVRRFGAKGDGETEDTAALQAAILSCPRNGRVRIPAGIYRTGPLFLKSHMTLEIQRGAELHLIDERPGFPVLPGTVFPTDGKGEELLLGSWEGNPLDMCAALLTGIGVKDVNIIGEGIVDGCATHDTWWRKDRIKVPPFRPRLLYLRDCKNITVQGLTFRKSPTWNLHPCFSENLDFLNVRVEAPAVSPNTDGFDPESCKNIRVLGTVFSVGDDCIAIKAGKIYMGSTYHTPCEEIEIAWCLMKDGHGGVTIGSEMAGGVRKVRIHHCRMEGNDRGLRIKTRRGRGKYAVIDDIRFEDVKMIGVKAPLVVNELYFCDPDGKSPYVQSREPQPADDTTPTVGRIVYERVRAEECAACVGYILGLPERPVEEIALKDCSFSFSENPQGMEQPAMALGVEPCAGRGVIAHNVKKLVLDKVTMTGVQGERLTLNNVETVKDR